MHLNGMKKRVMTGFLLLIMLISFAIADEHDVNATNSTVQGATSANAVENIDKAYQCLISEIEDKDSLSLQEAVFSVLALGPNDKLDSIISSEKSSSFNCWPKGSCKIKDTAQVLLAYQRAGRETAGIVSWLESKSIASSELSWYLEIDIANKVESECTVKYSGDERTVRIEEDMQISGSAGSCLTVSNSGYWLKVRDNCYDEEFEISCDEDFVTTLLYQKGNSGTVFVSSNTNSAPSLGTTSEKVESECFSTGSSCDYEGTLWATYALSKEGVNIDKYLPYLSALAEDNSKFFPESFLYVMVGGQDNYAEIVGSQKQSKFWEASASPYNRYYDSSLAFLAIGGEGYSEVENARNYFLQIQTDEGCWNNNNIRDTAFLLYSGWPKVVSTSGDEIVACESRGYVCGSALSCLSSGGQVLNEYVCTGNVNQVCCSANPSAPSCSEQGGEICGADEVCSDGNLAPSSQGSCCLSSCVEKQETSETCSDAGGTCRPVCQDGEETLSGETCKISGDVCCAVESGGDSQDGGNWWIWITLLSILIILVILGIIYRNKIKLWYYKWKGRAGSSPIRRGPPRGPPSGPRPIQFPRRPAPIFGKPIGTRRPLRPAPHSNHNDKEMEETMRKLKEMSQ